MRVMHVPISPTSSSTTSSTPSSIMASRTSAELGPVPRVAASAAGLRCRATAETTVYPPPTTGPVELAVTAPPGAGILLTWRGRSMRTLPVEMKQAGLRALMGLRPR